MEHLRAGIFKSAGDFNMLVATHNGSFHADEVTASVIFYLLDPETRFIRTRDPEAMEKADYVVDVSGQFDLEKHFDHHPREFRIFRENGIKYATAGLIWKKFGMTLLKKLAAETPDLGEVPENILKKAFDTVDRNVMEYTDLTDNGQLDSYTAQIAAPETPGETAVYHRVNRFFMHTPVIPYLVAMQNRHDGTDEEQLERFLDTVKALAVLYRNIFIKTVSDTLLEEEVIKAYDGSEILRLDKKLPWFDAVMNNWDIFTACKIAIYPDKKGFRIQSLPGSLSSRFINRCNSPLAWRGKEGEELRTISGISTITFVHNSGFTGGAETREDIDLMARKWID
jgi:uncharacterized UPF0160 family protein